MNSSPAATAACWPGLVVVQQRLEALGPLAVGPPVELHLDQAEVDPHLDLLAAVVAGDDPDLDSSGS